MPTRPPTHLQLLRQAKQALPDAKRPSAAARGYGHAWRKLRLMVLRRQPVCQDCQREPATQVDHILAKEKGGTDDMNNLRGLCISCHSKKTYREEGSLRVKTYGLDADAGGQ